jgi:hypothetical protein
VCKRERERAGEYERVGGRGLGESVRLCKERQIERESEYGSVRVCKSEKECVCKYV